MFLLQEKLLLKPMFEVPDSDIVAVHIDEKAVRGSGSVQYSHTTESNEVTSVSESSTVDQSKVRESLSRTEGSIAA